MFNDLLWYVSQLHVNLFIIFHCYEALVKCLLQLFKNTIWMVLNKVFSPFKEIILENKTKQVDDVNFHCFTINFNGLLEHYNVNIRITIFDKGWILQLFVRQFGYQFWYMLYNGLLIPWWYKHAWIRCWPFIRSNKWIK